MRVLRSMEGNSRWLGGVLAGATALLLVSAAWAVPPKTDSATKARLLGALSAGQNGGTPVIRTNPDGSVRYLGAPPGGYFAKPSAAKSGGAEAAAHAFVQEHAEAFGVNQANVSFRTVNVQYYNGFSYVRLQQQYAGVDILAAQIVVQLNGALNALNVMSEVLTDTSGLEDGSVPLTPSASADDALRSAFQRMAQLNPGMAIGDFTKTGKPEKLLYVPALLDQPGGPRLVWSVGVAAKDAGAAVCETALVDAVNGAVLSHYSQIPRLNNRRIWNANNSLYAWSEVERQIYENLYMTGDACFLQQIFADPASSALYQGYIKGMEVRVEGEPLCGIRAADNLYYLLGGCYDYYFEKFGRDGWNGLGAPFIGVVNAPLTAYDTWSMTLNYTCPIEIGLFAIEGMIQDDVVGHEFQHAVTSSVCDFIYVGESGGLHEGYSDAFGEFIDWYLSDWGNDSPEMRWYLGEDIPSAVMGTTRYMKDPTMFGNPDRRNSPYWQDEPHAAAGVHSKLVYLLTDGDTFNGYTVRGMGEERVEQLLYSALPMMTPAANYHDFANALSAAATSLSWSFDDRLNLANAIRAVEIEPLPDGATQGLGGLTDFRATPTRTNTGNPVILLTWVNPTGGDVRVQRSVEGFPIALGDGELLANGTIEQYLDSDLQAGVAYFYTLILDTGLPQMAFARAVADAPVPGILSEVFGYDPTAGSNGPFDLSFTQLLYTPVGPPLSQFGGAAATGSLGDYELTITPGVTDLPVAKGSDVLMLSLAKDGHFSGGIEPYSFPFFGRPYSQFTVAANGYISFLPLEAEDPLNLPTLESHYAIPRISFLFSRLDPQNSSGIWLKGLSDKLAITFEHVREVSGTGTTTVQTELFYSGHVRITYLEANAGHGITGLSDGRGLPVNPGDLFATLEPVPIAVDLSGASRSRARLSIDPITVQSVQEGDTVSFAVTTSPPELKPRLSAEWNGPGLAPFASQPDGTGVFSWETTMNDAGTYRVRILAELDGATTYQDVTMVVLDSYSLPTVSGVGLATDVAGDNPFESRAVEYGRALAVVYTYAHPDLLTNPGMFKEGSSIIYWYRNNEAVASFNNTRTISADQLFPGDTWYFEVIPVTASGILGDPVRSPSATISGDPVIEEISPPYGLTSGGETVRIRGRLFSFLRNGRLAGGPVEVLFGGVAAPKVTQISDKELEVITPVYAGNIAASAQTGDLVDVVDVTVIASGGTAYSPDAFTYKAVKNGASAEDTKAQNRLGCGGGAADRPGSAFSDLVLALGCAMALAAAGRRRLLS